MTFYKKLVSTADFVGDLKSGMTADIPLPEKRQSTGISSFNNPSLN